MGAKVGEIDQEKLREIQYFLDQKQDDKWLETKKVALNIDLPIWFILRPDLSGIKFAD